MSGTVPFTPWAHLRLPAFLYPTPLGTLASSDMRLLGDTTASDYMDRVHRCMATLDRATPQVTGPPHSGFYFLYNHPNRLILRSAPFTLGIRVEENQALLIGGRSGGNHGQALAVQINAAGRVFTDYYLLEYEHPSFGEVLGTMSRWMEKIVHRHQYTESQLGKFFCERENRRSERCHLTPKGFQISSPPTPQPFSFFSAPDAEGHSLIRARISPRNSGWCLRIYLYRPIEAEPLMPLSEGMTLFWSEITDKITGGLRK